MTPGVLNLFQNGPNRLLEAQDILLMTLTESLEKSAQLMENLEFILYWT